MTMTVITPIEHDPDIGEALWNFLLSLVDGDEDRLLRMWSKAPDAPGIPRTGKEEN